MGNYYNYRSITEEEVDFLIKHLDFMEDINSGQWNDKNILSDSGDYVMKDLRSHFEDQINTLYGIKDIMEEFKDNGIKNKYCPICGETMDDFEFEYENNSKDTRDNPLSEKFPTLAFYENREH